jgi:hypothetical protein
MVYEARKSRTYSDSLHCDQYRRATATAGKRRAGLRVAHRLNRQRVAARDATEQVEIVTKCQRSALTRRNPVGMPMGSATLTTGQR